MSSPASTFPARHGLGRSPRPGRRVPPACRRQPTSWTILLAVFVCFVSHALAAAPDAAVPTETLIINHKKPYREGQRWVMLSEQEIQRREAQRQDTSDEPEATESSEPSKISAGGSVTTTFSIAVGSSKPTSSSTSVPASPLPSILDSMSSDDFSPGPNGEEPPCPKFINSFLNDPTFKACYPLSMLFDRSKSFFEAQRSLVGITRTLDATCAADATSCNTYLAQLATDLTAPENCGAEFSLGQPSVVDAHTAMLAYAPVYSAGCLKDPETGAYCYASAVTNLTNPSSTYFYFLPLNKTLPGTTVPACGYCLRQIMALYQAATADRRQLITETYVQAAEQVNTICGPGFIDESLAAEVVPSGAAVVGVGRWGLGVATGVMLVVGVLWAL